MNIEKPSDFAKALKMPYAWPGGYPTYFITRDGAALCHKCGTKEAPRIITSIRDNDRDGWNVAACVINYEDTDLYCDHCNQQIESAYGETSRPTLVKPHDRGIKRRIS